MDHAAAAPELPSVRRAQARAGRLFGNPSSIHRDGVLAREALETARRDIAKAMNALPDEVVFTGSGTESDNMAVMGVFKHARLDPDFAGKEVHIITTAIEHPAVIEACRHLEAVGAQVTYLPVGENGIIDPKDLRAALREETILVSIAYVNNEIGTIQPIREISKTLRNFRKSRISNPESPDARHKTQDTRFGAYPLLHTDACQAAPYLNMNVEQLGVDLLTFNGTKLGGPHGVGALYVHRGTPTAPIMYGGGQENGLRSGTENVSAAAGLAAALIEAEKIKEKESARLKELQDYFFAEIETHFPEARINGSREFRSPNNVHVSFPNIASELLVLELDARGISASAGSACASAKDQGSHVLEALYGKDDDKKWGSVRFSFGRETKRSDIVFTIKALDHIVKKYEEWKK